MIKGIIPIVLTPFLKSGELDIESSHRLINSLINEGVGGLYILGSASEGYLLSVDQKIQVIRIMAQANAGRIPLIAGCSSIAPKDVLKIFDHTTDEKIHGFHYIPNDLKIGSTQFIKMVNYYADCSPAPLYLYHNTKRGRAILVEEAKILKQHKNIIGIKVGGYDEELMRAFLKIQDEEFQILGSGGGQLLKWLNLGAKACTASSACCFPKVFVKLYHYLKMGESLKAKKLQDWWINFHNAMPNTAPINGEYCAEEKYILLKQGMIKYDYCHFPLRSLIESEKKELNTVFTNHISKVEKLLSNNISNVKI